MRYNNVQNLYSTVSCLIRYIVLVEFSTIDSEEIPTPTYCNSVKKTPQNTDEKHQHNTDNNIHSDYVTCLRGLTNMAYYQS